MSASQRNIRAKNANRSSGSLDKMVRLPGSNQAHGCVTCLGCLAWPVVRRIPGSSRWGEVAYWSVYCVQCSTEPSTAATRQEAVADWNRRNERLGAAA